MNKWDYYTQAIEKSQEQKEFRQLQCISNLEDKHSQKYINFSSNDFLGLSSHPYVKKNSIEYVLKWGIGTTSSRIVIEHLEYRKTIEQKFANLLGQEKVLLFPAPYQVQDQILSTILNRHMDVFIDQHCNYRLIQGVIRPRARIFRYAHNNLTQLASLLAKTKENRVKWIVTESLFSIDGDLADLKKIEEIGAEYNCFIYVDDSNSFGVMGKNGMGLGAHRKGIDLLFGSFGKQSGTFGAYIGTSQLIDEYLLTFNPQLMEITMVAPAVLGAISSSLDLIPDMHIEREKIEYTSSTLRKELIQGQWDIGSSISHIIPIFYPNQQECEKISKAFLEQSILTTVLKPPVVPEKTTCIRLKINASHSEEDIAFFLKTLQDISTEPSLCVI